MGPLRTKRAVQGCQPLQLKITIGPNRIEIASDESGSSPERAAPIDNEPVTEFHCEYPGCERYFTAKSGRSLHQRRANKAWYDERALNARQPVKSNWSAEESAMLAKREAELTLQRVRFINKELRRTFPHRTINAIKGHRQSREHRLMVESFLEELRSAGGSSDESSEEYFSPPTSPTPVGAAQSPDKILDYLESLEPLTDNNCYQSVRLQEIATRARSTSKELIYHQLSEYLVEVLPPRTSVPPRRITPVARHLTRRQVRKREYSDTQRTWKRSRARCVDTILSGIGDTPQPPRERMESHWRDVITEPTTGSVPPCTRRPTLDGL